MTRESDTTDLDGNEVVDTKRAAKIVGLSPATLETLRSRGGGPPFVKVRRRVGYVVTQLRRWRDARMHECTSEY
jgi:hypothetical protein